MPDSDQRTSDPERGVVLHVVLEGEAAQLDSIPAQDVARLIDGAIRAIARAAELITGRTPGQVGRRGAAIEAATRFRLVGIQAGSVDVILRSPDLAAVEDVLDLEDDRLTELAVAQTLDAVEGGVGDVDPHLAAALAELGEELGVGSRYSDVRFDLHDSQHVRRTCRLDASARTRLREVSRRPRLAAATAVTGTLVEADFEKRTARLRTPNNRSVKVTFTDDNADAIQDALRRKAEFDGVVTYDARTQEALSVEMRSVVRADQTHLALDETGFWANQTVTDLATEQGVGVASRVTDLEGSDIDAKDADAFLVALSL